MKSLQLALATGAFATCFAVFGSVSAMMPLIRKSMELTPFQVSLALATPVLLGSLGRIPLGLLADRYGARLVFSATMAFSVLASLLVALAGTYPALLATGLLVGVALACFPIGVGMVSRWYPPEKQGFALGIYGAGNVGQSLAAFGSPVIAGALGYRWGFWFFAAVLTVWLVIFMLLARDAPGALPQRTLAQALAPLKDRRSWVLSLYYFLTFGGFVAMAVYLPTFLTEMFHLTPADAGMRTAGFILLATGMRPLGGSLSDRFGGQRVLHFVFPAVFLLAFFLACPLMSTFTVGALGMAAAIGVGNGAVFKLVPEQFPQSVGAVTGLVGAAGGLGGFFPPLVVGTLYQLTGSFSGGFILLAFFAGACVLLDRFAGSPPQGSSISKQPKMA